MSGIDIIFGIAILILSVVVHEIAHGYMADHLGDPTARLAGRLTFNPIKHIDMMGSVLVPAVTFLLGGFIFGWAKPVPFNPYNLRKGKYGEALVAFAGPASNIVIALLFGLVLRFGSFDGALLEALTFIVMINIVLAIFNLVPIPPLDGSKILFSLLPYQYNNVRLFLERHGMIVIILFILFLWRLIVPIVSILFGLVTGISF